MARETAIDPGFAELLARGDEAAAGPRGTAEAILEAAERLFVEHGYHATRVSEVARQADVSIGSIYVHFESKEGLYAALVERALEVEARYVDAVLDSAEIPDLEKTIALGEAYLQFFRDHPAYFRMLMIPVDDLPREAVETPLHRRVAARGARQREKLAGAIRNCIEEGLVRDDIDPQHAANFWWAAWNGMISLTMRRDQLALSEQEMEQVVIAGRLMIAEGTAPNALRDEDARIVEPLRERLQTLR